ncbi:SPOR domain-containing protein [Sulfuricystis multivorans]|uniref:SPOR domain-containing protein n=1 Tax=Sulfuricystis multivorans TaxID=2211108 RepID=UPI000F8450E3|nr:SPOR domain-containing protein [Sulfuricystis multivorans]
MNMTQRGGTLIGLMLGILVGVLISFGVVWYLNKTPLPFTEKVSRPEVANGAKEPLALPGKPGDKPVGSERKFEFYDILEGKKPPAAEAQATAPAATETPAKPEPTATAGASYLQVGAFQKKTDADNLRAKLAMLGFEANVLQVEVPGKGTVHRVRLGPFASLDELNQARRELSEQGVQTTVVRAQD